MKKSENFETLFLNILLIFLPIRLILGRTIATFI